MKADRIETEETSMKAMPSEVGGSLREMIGAREAAERMKRMKLKKDKRMLRKEHEFLILFGKEEEAIFVIAK